MIRFASCIAGADNNRYSHDDPEEPVPPKITGWNRTLAQHIAPLAVSHHPWAPLKVAMSAELPVVTSSAHSLLNRLVKGAVRSRHIAFNPVVGAPLPSLPRQEKSFLSPSEIDHLAGSIDPSYIVWLYTMAWTGLRFGEAAALRRRNVDVLRSEISVVEAVTEVNGKVHFGSTKSNRHRTVYVPGFLRDMLNKQLTTTVGPGPDALVFTAPRGGVLRRHNLGRRVWKPATQAAGFDGLRMHDLRHTAAALMIAVNESPELVKRQLGHSSIEVTFDVYGHLFPSSMENLVGGLDRLYREAQTG